VTGILRVVIELDIESEEGGYVSEQDRGFPSLDTIVVPWGG